MTNRHNTPPRIWVWGGAFQHGVTYHEPREDSPSSTMASVAQRGIASEYLRRDVVDEVLGDHLETLLWNCGVERRRDDMVKDFIARIHGALDNPAERP